ncbi:YihY/virulence factor BrkB family protein [Luteolibacter marinus]|uniref:YihY/virulence factor BrkB family protein n=1 Tax=Luteolibacter marinus TaxID=2776705 RepID=UPI0018673969|nr:YihY/virulence factor BrkB family protein [Luteolibacter marinus]
MSLVASRPKPRAVDVIKAASKAWSEDHAMRLSAALAYYSVFSIGPILIIAISIAGTMFGEDAARGAIEAQLSGAMGQDAASALQGMIEGARDSGKNGVMAVVGFAILIFSASGLFTQLKDALNTVWRITPATDGGVTGFLRKRAMAISMVLVFGFLLLVSLVLSAMVSGLTRYLEHLLPVPGVIWQFASFLISMVVVTSLFAMIFKILPDAKVEWRDVWTGSILTAALFSIGQLLLGLYLGRQETASTYGVAGALVLLLSWVYYSANILLFGAEFTRASARLRGRRIEPARGARRVV